MLSGCSRDTGIPLSFHLSDKDQGGAPAIPASSPAFVVSQLRMVASDAPQRKVTIKLLAADASAFEKLTTDNFGKTLIVVQGANVLATPRISESISARAGIILLIGTNVDFEHTYRELLKLSRQ